MSYIRRDGENYIVPENELPFDYWEKEWRKSLGNTTPADLLTTFPEGAATVRKLLTANRKERKRLFEMMKERLKHAETLIDESTRAAVELVIESYLGSRIVALDDYYKKWRPHVYRASISRKSSSRIDVMSAKEAPILDVLMRFGVEVRLNKIPCPFHNERTPSCIIYAATNTFNCFGCQNGGDVISLVMRLGNMSFKEAASWLNTHFK